jgi:hypothetical protein
VDIPWSRLAREGKQTAALDLDRCISCLPVLPEV